jgi:ribonuclease III
VTDLPSARQSQLQAFVQTLGLPPRIVLPWERLNWALTHKSIDAVNNYEQLELLGDAVLRLAATEYLQEQWPEASVGELSAVRSQLISDRTLGQLAQELGLTPHLLLGPGLSPQPSHLADALEAVVAVLYLETHNLALVRCWLEAPLKQLAIAVRQDPARRNYKAALQEITQAHNKTLPQYRTIEQRPVDGDPQRYIATVWFQETRWGTGYGATRKQAEQTAAAAAYNRLRCHLSDDQPPSE